MILLVVDAAGGLCEPDGHSDFSKRPNGEQHCKSPHKQAGRAFQIGRGVTAEGFFDVRGFSTLLRY